MAVLYSCKYSTVKPQYNEVCKIGNMLHYIQILFIEIWPFMQLSTVGNGFFLHGRACKISCHVENIGGITRQSQRRPQWDDTIVKGTGSGEWMLCLPFTCTHKFPKLEVTQPLKSPVLHMMPLPLCTCGRGDRLPLKQCVSCGCT